MATAFLSSLFFFGVEGALFCQLFVRLFVIFMMRVQTLVPCFTSRFVFIELTFGKMPTLTRRSRASTFQIVSARLSKNDTRITFALGYFFSSTQLDLVPLMAQKVWRLSVLVFVHDRYAHARNCTGLPSNIGLFLSNGNKYLFLLQRHVIPFNSCPLLLFQFSHAWRQSFVIVVLIYTPFHHCPLILTTWHRKIMMNLHVVQF